jgi:hypothetical protein
VPETVKEKTVAKSFNVTRALRLAAALKGQLKVLDEQLALSSTWVESRKPDYDFTAVLAERRRVDENLVRLKAALAVANAKAEVVWRGRKLTAAEAVVRLQELDGELALLKRLRFDAGVEEKSEHVLDRGRGGYVEATTKVVKVAAWTLLQRDAELRRLASDRAELNDVLEDVNHGTRFDVELLEEPPSSVPAAAPAASV